MSGCSASYNFTSLPINTAGTCGATCKNVTFDLTSVETSAAGEECLFEWTVTRTKRDDDGSFLSSTEFSGEAGLGCPDVKKITFYCDAFNNCPAYELCLMCMTVD